MEILIPDIIDPDCPERYILTLRVHPEQFSFTIYEPGNEGCYFYHKVKVPERKSVDPFPDFKQFFFENPFFASSFKKNYILNYSEEFTFVPDFLYERDCLEKLMQFNFSHSSGKLLAQRLHQSEIVILHQMPKDVFQFLNRSFANPQFIHHLSPLITCFQEKSRLSDSLQLSVNLCGKDLDVICFFHGDFILGNHFKINQIQDSIYYILFICKQLKFRQTKDLIYCCGNQNQQAELIKGLNPFISNIILLDSFVNDHFSGTDIPFELSSMLLCEL